MANGKEVRPFFYYQFYTFEELYSHNSVGPNPKFEDTKSYEVTFDAKALEYFSTQSLEVMFFDDHAPIGAQGN